MVTIRHLKVKRNYRYLWLKTVTGIDLSKHCAACLKGDYINNINPTVKSIENVVLPESKIYYLCGVDGYETNLHIAFSPCDKSEVRLDDDKVSLLISGAKQIEINESLINWDLPQSKYKQYNTCRNWWFANMLSRTGGI